MQEPELAGDPRETVSSRHSKAEAPMNSRRLWQDPQDLHKFKPDKNPHTEKEK